MPDLRPTVLIAAETTSVLGVLRDTFPGRETSAVRDRSGRVLEGRTDNYRYYMIAMQTTGKSEYSGMNPAKLVAELGWYTGRLSPIDAVLLVGAEEELILADCVISRSSPVDAGGPEFLPDLIRALPADLPVGTIRNDAILAATRWLATRFGPHQVWSVTVPRSIPPDRNDRSEYHRLLRALASALVDQAR